MSVGKRLLELALPSVVFGGGGAAVGGLSGAIGGGLGSGGSPTMTGFPTSEKEIDFEHGARRGGTFGGAVGSIAGVGLGALAGAIGSKEFKRDMMELPSAVPAVAGSMLGLAVLRAALGNSDKYPAHGSLAKKIRSNDKERLRDVAAATLGSLAGFALGGGLGAKAEEVINAERYEQAREKTRREYDDIFERLFGGRPGASISRPERLPRPQWLPTDITTKADAKKRYLTLAAANHPDRGGDVEKMKQVNREWTAFRNSPDFDKLARMNTIFSAGFVDEIEKVACGPMTSDGGSSLWSDRFKGTPLAEAAINLEIQQANSDMQFDEQEAQKRQRDAQEGNIWDARNRANDQFRLAKKKMEKQLLISQLQQAAGDREEGWQNLDEVQKPQAPGRQPTMPQPGQDNGATVNDPAATQSDSPQAG